MSGIPVDRVNLSLPCMVPVLPGTPRVDAPIEERTETCNVDAWWIIGLAWTCDLHLRQLLDSDEYQATLTALRESGWQAEVPNPTEQKPWDQMHRYEQEPQFLPEKHPVREMAEGRT